MESKEKKKKHSVGIYWFRNSLRLHDNPSLLAASHSCKCLLPLYIIDPLAPFAQTPGRKAGAIRANFILEAMQQLDKKLSSSCDKSGDSRSRLVVAVGKPHVVLPQIVQRIQAKALYYEREVAHPVREMDRLVLDEIVKVQTLKRQEEGGDEKDILDIVGFDTHTIHPIDHYIALCKDHVAPSTYGGFTKMFERLQVPEEVPTVDLETFPPLPTEYHENRLSSSLYDAENDRALGIGTSKLPTLQDLGYDQKDIEHRFESGIDFIGGEDEGLALMKKMLQRTSWICTFEKPKTSPNALTVDTTGLSPYIKHGCLSPRRFYHELTKVYSIFNPSKLSKPPVSLHGQLMWREYNYLMGYTTPNFDKMINNPVARQIPWDDDPVLLSAWKNARTGYPYIDAIMTQLKQTGWIHHLARHSVACFLTRGDLWQSWEKGAEHFEEELIDADWSINNFNWQWLSCTAHFYQYFRCYSPVSFGKKTDKEGAYIRKWLPQFKDFPSKYIYEPWTAPPHVQQKCGVIIGNDYPEPIVDHMEISKSNMGRMKAAYDAQKAMEVEAASSAKKKAKTG
mmetsp:Transcript_15839/g.29886  ORF Transcript_15839/g.29886 Transcript_15839/m.29886 type:complete len:565 (-) Transcript_15839:8-1702(-)